MFCFPNKIYPITDVRISGLSHCAQVERLIAGGATIIQLREKTSSAREFFKDAQQAIAVARAHKVQIIINDQVDVAFALRADGVHLGQGDIPPQAARKILGANAVIGFSVHNTEQARAATNLPIDYLGIGPIFPTSTKMNPDPVVGLQGLQQAREVTGSLPLVAIGGIDAPGISTVLAAGANAVALIRGLLENQLEITARMNHLINQSHT